MNWSRRKILQAVSVLLTFANARRISAADENLRKSGIDSFEFATLFESRRNIRSAAVIGEIFLRQCNRRWSRIDLINLVTQSIHRSADQRPTKPLEQYDRLTLRRFVADAIANDFAEGQSLEIGGWILAKTEVHLCALVKQETAA